MDKRIFTAANMPAGSLQILRYTIAAYFQQIKGVLERMRRHYRYCRYCMCHHLWIFVTVEGYIPGMDLGYPVSIA